MHGATTWAYIFPEAYPNQPRARHCFINQLCHSHDITLGEVEVEELAAAWVSGNGPARVVDKGRTRPDVPATGF